METRDAKKSDTEYRVYDARSLGRGIRHYRLAHDLTQAELAARTGVTRQYISEMERGLETEQLRTLLRVLRTLGIRIALQPQDW